MRRFSYQDWVKTAPGISPTSPTGSSVLVSALGSGVDQNQYLLDGTSITATGNGVSRAEPGVDFIQELQIQSVGASVEYGNVQGAVVNVISKSGGNRFQYDAAYHWQTASLTSQPVRRVYDLARQLDSGYERAAYRDFTTSLGGPIVRDRLWFFSGYQHLRDSDSQPGTNPDLPREYEQDKVFAKVTWRVAPGWQLTQSFHDEFWSNPETPSATKPREATQRLDASVPAINFGHLIHTASPNTVWDIRVGRFRFTQDTSPTSGDPTIPNRIDQPENIWSGGPQQIGQVRQVRTTVKATVSHYRAAWFGGDHEWRMGAQVDRGEHRAVAVLPTGASSVYRNGVLRQRTLQAPANSGGRFVTAAVFVSDAVRLGGRVTINPGLRYDHSRAISQDVPEFDLFVRETGRTIEGRGTVDSWNTVSPRVGVVIKLDTDGRTMLRANAGRFSQGLLTGEISAIHPGRTRNTIIQEPSGATLVRDPSQVQLDPELRLPYTNQYLDRAGSRGGWSARGLRGVRPQGRPRLHRMDGTRRRVSPRARDLERWPRRAGLETDHPFGGTSLSADESGGLLADLQRPGHCGRATTIPRLAGIRVLHVVEGVRPAALERDDRSGPAGRDRRLPTSLVRARSHVRTGSERCHQRLRPLAQRSPAHVSRDDVGRRATHRLRGRSQSAASQRQAVGNDSPGQPQ